MWKDYLDKIRSINKEYNSSMNPGCSEELIAKFEQAASDYLGSNLPDGYKEFLKEVNGLEFNGFIFFGVDDFVSEFDGINENTGLIDCNQELYESERQLQYLFFVDSDISWYAYDFKKEVYVLLDKPSGEEEEQYETFSDMLDHALEEALPSLDE